ncbi:MAG: S1 RNA-binding domain-containing protein [Candidatus Eisenbacteria bacterium]
MGEASEGIALFSSRREANAETAEREIIRLKSVRYLEERLGKEAAGHVTGITPRGLFVELDRVPVDGFVPAQTLPHRAQFVEERLAWIDSRSGWELRPGDAVRIQIVAADVRLRRTEFVLLDVPRGGVRPGRRRAGGDERREGRRSTGRTGGTGRGGRRTSASAPSRKTAGRGAKKRRTTRGAAPPRSRGGGRRTRKRR